MDLVACFDRLLRATGPVRLPVADIVHGDFNTCNILLEGRRVSGIVDTGDVGRGPRAFDYACLLRESHVEDYGESVTAPLLYAARKASDSGVLMVCAAAAAFDIVRFKLRFDPGRLEGTISGLFRLSAHLHTLLPPRTP